MDVVKKCPKCGSQKITGGISIERGRYIQKINCEECGYKNNRDIGSAENSY